MANERYAAFDGREADRVLQPAETGAVVAQYTYDGFGRTLSAIGPMADFFRHRFSTKYYDPETGFYYYGYRYYAPDLTRWTTRDPIGEDGVSFHDPLGESPREF